MPAQGWAIAGSPPSVNSAPLPSRHRLEQPQGTRLTVTVQFRFPRQGPFARHGSGCGVTTAADPLAPGAAQKSGTLWLRCPPQRTPGAAAAPAAEAGAWIPNAATCSPHWRPPGHRCPPMPAWLSCRTPSPRQTARSRSSQNRQLRQDVSAKRRANGQPPSHRCPGSGVGVDQLP